jgi:hypothetical protein
MNMLSLLFTIVVFVVLAYAGLLRPTGLLGRTRAEEETERQRDAAARVLKNSDEASDLPFD